MHAGALAAVGMEARDDRMDIATLAMAIAVLQEGSVRGAGRLLGRAPSSVADAFERLETDLAMTLALRVEGALSLTLAGETLSRSSSDLVIGLRALAGLADRDAAATVGTALAWAARNPIPISLLSHFNAVVRVGSIRRAAHVLGIGQPNLSRQMSRLEAMLGCSLLQRTSMGCEPSVRGLKLDEISLALVEVVSGLAAPAKTRFAREVRTVKLGTIIPIGHESRLAARLANLVASWRTDKAKPELLVSSTTAEDLMEGLKAGRFDIALMDTAMRHKRFETIEIFSSELVLVGPAAAIAATPSLQGLIRSNPIAVPSLRSGLRQRIREVLEPLVDDTGGGAAPWVEVDALSIIINLVLDHGYLSVLPIDAVVSLDRQIGIAQLPGAPRLGFHLVWPRTLAAQKIATSMSETLAGAVRTASANP